MNFLDLSIERGLSAEHGSSVSDAIEGQDHIRCLEGPSEAIESTPLARFLSEKVTRSCPGQNDDSLRESVGDPENNVSAGSAVDSVIAHDRGQVGLSKMLKGLLDRFDAA